MLPAKLSSQISSRTSRASFAFSSRKTRAIAYLPLPRRPWRCRWRLTWGCWRPQPRGRFRLRAAENLSPARLRPRLLVRRPAAPYLEAPAWLGPSAGRSAGSRACGRAARGLAGRRAQVGRPKWQRPVADGRLQSGCMQIQSGSLVIVNVCVCICIHANVVG